MSKPLLQAEWRLSPPYREPCATNSRMETLRSYGSANEGGFKDESLSQKHNGYLLRWWARDGMDNSMDP